LIAILQAIRNNANIICKNENWKRIDMDWNSMKVFLEIAQHRNLIVAAKTLKMSHSTVFRRLQSLEEDVGSRLFERENGIYQLTELGEELSQLGKNVSNSFDDIERHIIGRDMSPQGSVKITCPTSIAYTHLPQILQKLSLLHPKITIEVLVSDQAVNMRNRIADIALRVTAAPPDFLVGRQIKEFQWAVYASKDYLATYGRPSRLADLAGHQFIGASGSLADMEAFTWLDKKHLDNIVLRSDDLVTMSQMASTGMGLAILPDDLRIPSLERLFTFKPAAANKLWVLTHPDLRKVERIKIVMKYLTQSLA
jgi:DNA-binding transcriptional LysR family regulator